MRLLPGLPIMRGDNCFCFECGLSFRRTWSYQKHLTGLLGDRRCKSTASLRNEGWRQDAKGFWLLPAKDYPRRTDP